MLQSILPPKDEQFISSSSSAHHCPTHLLCDKDTVLDLLLSLDTSKVSGPDSISAEMLKNTAASIYQSVTKIANPSISTGHVYLCSLLDFQKAFDSVPHIPLIKKLQCIRMDLDEHLILWTKNYLSQRIQSVAVNGVTSSPRPVIFGVPQGSVLGPLLCLIYFTTISLSPLSRCVLYADDVLLYRLVTSPQDARARRTRPGLYTAYANGRLAILIQYRWFHLKLQHVSYYSWSV